MADFLILNHKDLEVHGIIHNLKNVDNIQHIKNKINIHSGDLNDSKSLISILNNVEPTKIFHLAAQSNVMESFKNPTKTFQTNIFGTLNLLEAIRNTNIDPIIQISSSSEIYGKISKNQIPIKENTLFFPVNPYGVSKITVDRLGFQYFQTYGLKTIITRAFPHTGARRNSYFAESSFAKQLIEIENGKDNKIVVGNLDITRTILDVRDMVEAYWMSTEKCTFGEAYNIGSEIPVTINQLLSKLIQICNTKVSITKDPKLFRPSNSSKHIPDTSKFKKQTNWKPKIPLQKTLEDLLNYWRKQLSTV